jgi:hypothetical protein
MRVSAYPGVRVTHARAHAPAAPRARARIAHPGTRPGAPARPLPHARARVCARGQTPRENLPYRNLELS